MDKAIDGMMPEPNQTPAPERESGGVMTFDKAVDFLGGKWLKERVQRGGGCICGACTYCAYLQLTGTHHNEVGLIQKPSNGEYLAACIVCKNHKPVMLYPHRLDGLMVGWVFVCADDEKRLRDADILITLKPEKPHKVTLGSNPDA